MEPGSNDRPNDSSRQSGTWQSNYSSDRDSRGSRSGASWGENAVSGLLQISREVDRAIESMRIYGSFRRHIPLPEGAQTEQAKATMRDGVLQITVPVSRDIKRRSIEIAD
jgi:hypothetical protein